MDWPKLDPEFKARWVAALRSGNYKQGLRYLRRGDEYCCLGVAADLCDVDWVPSPGIRFDDRNVFRMAGTGGQMYGRSLLPEDFIEGLPSDVQRKLSQYNDRAVKFDFIADWIEANL